MNNYYGTDAIILASRERGEADAYLTFFTKDLGRINAVASGVRLAKSKLRGHLTLFSRLRLMLARGNTAWRIIDAESDFIVSDGEIIYRKRCADFISRVVGEEEPDIDMWNVMLDLNCVGYFSDEMRFKLRVLEISGFLPHVSEQGRFFSAKARAFIAKRTDDTLFADLNERRAFEDAIDGILRANHMLY